MLDTLQQSSNRSLLNQIGNTPLIPLCKMSAGLPSTILAKAEMLNPSGSVKDRLASYLINDAKKRGVLKSGGTVIEVTSGNTGISIAWICATLAFKTIIVMSDKNSREKQDMIKLFGAELVITPHDASLDSPDCSHRTAERLARERNNSTYLDQFNNPANIDCHYHTTGPEIWKQTKGKVDCLIAGVGTGGTISGAARYLKEQNPGVRIVAVDPQGSMFKTYFETGKIVETQHYHVEGIGTDRMVEAIDFNVIDEFVDICDMEAFHTTRELAKIEGLFCGGSSGAAIAAARRILRKHDSIRYPVIVLPDSGNRYLSKLYSDHWMRNM